MQSSNEYIVIKFTFKTLDVIIYLFIHFEETQNVFEMT
jgi:hypothetical protein